MLPPYPACGSWNGINQTDRQVDCGGRWRHGQRGRRKDGVIVGGRRGKGGGGTHMIDVAVYHRERSGLNSGCMQSGWGAGLSYKHRQYKGTDHTEDRDGAWCSHISAGAREGSNTQTCTSQGTRATLNVPLTFSHHRLEPAGCHPDPVQALNPSRAEESCCQLTAGERGGGGGG